jgi:uroporphyrinogen decarboxylase
MASGRSLPIIEDVIKTGTAVLGTSNLEDLEKVKECTKGKITILGNLNGLEMIHWNQLQVEQHVKTAITKAGPGGGFILSDNHGEIPFQVPDETLLHIVESVKRHGTYPLQNIKNA